MNADLGQLLQDVLAFDGLVWLIIAVTVAGIVRGFSGFGTAMIYMPVAGSFLSPVWALITVLVFDLIGPLPIVPRAVRDGRPREVLSLALGALVTLPIGIWLLTRLDPVVFRWVVSIAALLLLAILLSGWRYSAKVNKPVTVGIGGLGGFLGGISGLAGPPVIMFYMSGKESIATIRANILLYLLFVDIFALAIFAFSGLLQLMPVLIGGILVVPYTLGNIVGAKIFNPDKEKTYRMFAYGIIAISAVRGLPLFS